jgi:hypothetical protein
LPTSVAAVHLEAAESNKRVVSSPSESPRPSRDRRRSNAGLGTLPSERRRHTVRAARVHRADTGDESPFLKRPTESIVTFDPVSGEGRVLARRHERPADPQAHVVDGTVVVQCLADVFEEYRIHPEAKAAGPDGPWRGPGLAGYSSLRNWSSAIWSGSARNPTGHPRPTPWMRRLISPCPTRCRSVLGARVHRPVDTAGARKRAAGERNAEGARGVDRSASRCATDAQSDQCPSRWSTDATGGGSSSGRLEEQSAAQRPLRQTNNTLRFSTGSVAIPRGG